MDKAQGKDEYGRRFIDDKLFVGRRDEMLSLFSCNCITREDGNSWRMNNLFREEKTHR